MGWDYTTEEQERWQLNERGGMQGDYREGMQKKIANVIDCLRTEPLSKRAVIPIPFNSEGSETVDWTEQGQNKLGCLDLGSIIQKEEEEERRMVQTYPIQQ